MPSKIWAILAVLGLNPLLARGQLFAPIPQPIPGVFDTDLTQAAAPLALPSTLFSELIQQDPQDVLPPAGDLLVSLTCTIYLSEAFTQTWQPKYHTGMQR